VASDDRDNDAVISDARVRNLLRWRLAIAEREAPTPPRAAELVAAVRPWWERLPEHFTEMARRLGRMQVTYGYALDDAKRSSAAGGYPVPALVTPPGDFATFARVMYLSLRDGQLRLRFSLEDSLPTPSESVEVTFVATDSSRPICSALAHQHIDGEFRVEAAIPVELQQRWQTLRVTDPMPFRFILRPTHAA
jgi:hypothetical protein